MGFKLFYSFLLGIGIFVLGLILLVAVGVGTGEDAAFWEVSLHNLILWVAQLAMCFVWIQKSWVRGYKLSVKKWDIPIGLGAGLILQFPISFLLYLPFSPFVDVGKVSENATELGDRVNDVGGRILLGLVVILFGPIVEEIFFRGFLQNIFETFFGRSAQAKHWIIFLVAGIFSIAHTTSFSSAGLLPLWGLFILGIVLGYSVHMTRRLGMAIFIHISFNALAFILVLT